MAEACKRLIKNRIICWNYFYLSQKLEKIEDAASRQVFLDAVAHGSVISWQHITCWASMIFRTKSCGIASESDPQN